MKYISIIFFSFLFSQNCLLYDSCDDCYDAGCFWQLTEVAGEQCFDECMIADLSCYGQTNSWTAECPQETVSGYLKSVEISFCMDECSQYYIESEDNSCKISACIDSFISTNISGSISNSSISNSLALVSEDKFSIRFATSEGCKSSNV